MANPTTNFGWVMPTSTDLVTDLPADFNVFGQGVDTSLQYLLGGTTGQVLSKTSATNMAFTWVTPTDQTPLTTKGDLFTFSTVDARLGVGTNGQTLVADSAEATGLKWATAAAGGAFTSLATGSLTGGSSVTISSISGSYTDLKLVIVNPDNTANNRVIWVKVNGDANTRYKNDNNSTTGVSNGTFSEGAWYVSPGSSNGTTVGLVNLDIYNYANSTTWKIGHTFGINANSATTTNYNTSTTWHVYNQTAAITSLVLYDPDGGTLDGGTYTLYGVK
jgi:hypothetical protein